MTLRWGVLGPGGIAGAFVRGVADAPDCSVTAVASRDTGRARAFAAEHGVPHWYGSYRQMLSDPDVDAVYIALPNSLHAQWSIAAARAGRHVLCEKPLAVDRAAAEVMADVARRHGVLLAEGFMYRFHPRTRRLVELLRNGAVGPVRLVRSSFGIAVTDTRASRLDPELGGGALRDVGCYCVNLARLAVGAAPSSVTAVARWTSGVDQTLAGTLDYGGALAQVSCSLASGRHDTAQVVGEGGVIEVPSAFLPPPDAPARLLLRREGEPPTELTFPPVDQYRLEAEAFAGQVSRPDGLGPRELPLAETLENLGTIDALLRAARSGQAEQL